jgi:ankyrin repeat protein
MPGLAWILLGVAGGAAVLALEEWRSKRANLRVRLGMRAFEGDVEAVRALLAEGAPPGATPCANPLYAAAEQGHAEIVGLLLEAGASPDAHSRGVSPLYAAARRGHGDVLDKLFAAGADPGARNAAGVPSGHAGATALHAAAGAGKREVVEELLARGADAHAADAAGRTPAAWARSQGAELIEKRLAGATQS